MMSTRLQKKLPIGRPLDKGNPSHGNEINTRRPDSTCVWTSLSFFHCTWVQTSLFYPLRMCFRSRVFRRLFFFTAHPHRRLIFPLSMRSVSLFSFPLLIRSDVSFFPLRMRSDVSLFISAAHPFSRLLVMKSREKRPGMPLQEMMRDSLPQSLA